jgi:hypothetical protein
LNFISYATLIKKGRERMKGKGREETGKKKN